MLVLSPCVQNTTLSKMPYIKLTRTLNPRHTHQCLRWDGDGAYYEVLDGKLFEGRFNLVRYPYCSRRTAVFVQGYLLHKVVMELNL